MISTRVTANFLSTSNVAAGSDEWLAASCRENIQVSHPPPPRSFTRTFCLESLNACSWPLRSRQPIGHASNAPSRIGTKGRVDAVSQSSSSMHYAPIGSLDDDNLSVTQHRLLLRVFYQASMAAFWASRNWSIAVAFVTSTVLYITV
jgi:hypothetical protein